MDLLFEIEGKPEGAPAIDHEGAVVTYGELRSRVATLAAEFRRRGVDRGGRVAMHLPHGPLEPAIPLAAWHAGSVAVPLDLHWPVDRVREILDRSDAGLLVARGQRGAALARRLGAPWPERTILVEAPTSWPGDRVEALPPDPGLPPLTDLRSDDAASILFTSGSTGVPKGVTLTRENVDVFATHWAAELGLARGDRVAHCSDLAFDLSLLEIGATLCGGATVVPVPEALLGFPRDLAPWVARRGISVWYSVPSLVVGLIREGLAGLEPRHRLRALLYAGERMGVDEAVAVRRAFPYARILNLFGPTETNVSCFHELPRDHGGGEVPIGRPCPYLDLRLLDDAGREADEGEIVASGGTVMAGYWAEPRREQWVEIEGRRYLCTGDRARRDESGVLTFLGRADRMIKIRGYRVEPEEVEAALAEIAGVDRAVVVPAGGALERPRLAALVQVDPSTSLDPDAIRGALAKRLPGYAIPDLLVAVDELPRTARGKVDVARAREIAGRHAAGEAPTAPGSVR